MRSPMEIVEAGWYRPCGGTTTQRLYFIGLEIERELAAERERCAKIEATLIAIAAMPNEDDEWDGRDKFREVRAIAQNGLKD